MVNPNVKIGKTNKEKSKFKWPNNPYSVAIAKPPQIPDKNQTSLKMSSDEEKNLDKATKQNEEKKGYKPFNLNLEGIEHSGQLADQLNPANCTPDNAIAIQQNAKLRVFLQKERAKLDIEKKEIEALRDKNWKEIETLRDTPNMNALNLHTPLYPNVGTFHSRQLDLSNVGHHGNNIDERNNFSKTTAPQKGQQNTDDRHYYKKPTLPPMTRGRPDLWWRQVEQEMEFMRVPQKDRFNYVLTGLNPEMIEKLEGAYDINPVSPRALELLQELINSKYGLTNTEKLDELINKMQLGDNKPSDLLTKMCSMGADIIKKDILVDQFIKKLPAEVKPAIAAARNSPLLELGKLADYTVQLTKNENTVSEVKTDKTEELKAEIASLRSEWRNYRSPRSKERSYRAGRDRRNNRYDRSSSRGSDYSHSGSRGRSSRSPRRRELTPYRRDRRESSVEYRKKQYRNSGNLCFNHYVYRNQARGCQAPCQWGKNTNKNNDKNKSSN